MIKWTGIFPALTTKFDAGDKLDISLFNKNLREQLDAGVNGIILGGTLGEASTLNESEKEILVRNTV
ncbi:MAG: dihydrodipicolinate synthase family protein, partial [Saprospiraceae bacterium]|nr:dihydrodipicolinate synthase family protein [Saprospiraceae bacterium]